MVKVSTHRTHRRRHTPSPTRLRATNLRLKLSNLLRVSLTSTFMIMLLPLHPQLQRLLLMHQNLHLALRILRLELAVLVLAELALRHLELLLHVLHILQFALHDFQVVRLLEFPVLDGDEEVTVFADFLA